ncbi:MAG: LuxR C-terminal-related transcriptional regulator [Chloroflexota bacterium]
MSQPVLSFNSSPDQLPLLATKTFTPRARGRLVPRPHLMLRLDDALQGRLTLVSAPAGFGKTTLLAEWLRDRPEGTCWLSLDAADNDPPRFLSYVVAALQGAAPGLAGDLSLALRSPQPPSVEAVVTALVNELASVPGRVTLVLDDYHVITSPAVNGALTFLLENLPPNAHLVISTRSDPPLPIARLRSRGQVVEVRADELRLTPEEAATFLGEAMGQALAPEQVAALDERTEGWIAGLQMAALSIRGRDDVDGFIRGFAGTNRFILDFLVEEVLSREPEGVQSFLLQTAVLNRLCGPLCDAVTGASDGQKMLERLERRNLFVVPLDDERRWYRYHHLFADLLRARLYQAGVAPVAGLLSHAAEWCEREGQIGEAVTYALAAKDYGRAAGLVARYWEQTTSNGEIETVWSWPEALPEDVVRCSASLSVVLCWVLWLKAEVGLIEAHLVDAERAVPEGAGADDEIYAALPAHLAALRAFVARYQSDPEAAVAHAERALALVPGDLSPQASLQLRTVIFLALAAAYGAAGDLERAVSAYAEVIRLSRLGRIATGIAVTYILIGPLRLLGRLRAAEAACHEALRFVEEKGMARLPATGILHLAMGEILLERNELEAAEAHLSRCMELGRRSGRLDAVKNAAPALARLRQARRDATGALAAVREAEAALGEPPPPLALAELLALEARILVWQGALPKATACAREAVRLAGRDRGQTGAMVALAALRVQLARWEPDEAVAQLTRSLAAAEEGGRWGTAIELRILRGLAHARQGNTRKAEADLERALVLAEPEGYARIFVDEGEPVASLLRGLAARQARPAENAGYSAEYLATLLAAFGAPDDGRPTASSVPAGGAVLPSGPARTGRKEHLGRPSPLVEALSERERQVLRLMAEGSTNEQIAAELIIARGTVKAHVHNISGKLGAQNRAHAVALAKELGLL